MTAKEALLERVHDFSEEEAEELLARLDWESTETDTLTPEEWDDVLAGERAIAAGDWVSLEEVKLRLGR
jgi:hypothetical protein